MPMLPYDTRVPLKECCSLTYFNFCVAYIFDQRERKGERRGGLCITKTDDGPIG